MCSVAIVKNFIMIPDKGGSVKTERSKNDLVLSFTLGGGSVHYHLQCALFVYIREMLVPLTLYDGTQRESRTCDNAGMRSFSFGAKYFALIFSVAQRRRRNFC